MSRFHKNCSYKIIPLIARFGGFVSLFRVLVHTISELVSESGYCSDAFAM